eukprot:gene14720-20761_t
MSETRDPKIAVPPAVAPSGPDSGRSRGPYSPLLPLLAKARTDHRRAAPHFPSPVSVRT